ncbi:MAG: hypothetical protein ABI134_00070, partial [Byssovorax sp.]
YEVKNDLELDPRSSAPSLVGEAVTSTCSLVPIESWENLPAKILSDQLYIPKAHSLPGAGRQLAPGTQVLVGFVGGSPSKPFVAFYLSGQPLPVAVSVSATSKIVLGSEVSAKSAAYGQDSDSNFTALRTAVNTALAALALPTIPALPVVSSSKVKIE